MARRSVKLEKVVEDAVVKWARERGILVTKLNLLGHRSMPDRCLWLPGGRPLLIEFKRLGLLPTKAQQHTIDLLKRLGYDTYSFDNKEAAINIIRFHITKRALEAARLSEEGDEIPAGARKRRTVS